MENSEIRHRKISSLLAASAAYLFARTILPMVKPGHLSGVWLIGLALSSLLIMMLIQLSLVMGFSKLKLGARQAGLWALISAVIFAALLIFKVTVRLRLPGVAVGLVDTVHQFSLISLAVCSGVAISHIIRERNLLLPVAIIAAMVDFWNVYFGPLGQVVATKPQVVQVVTVQMPTAVPGMPVPMIGMGDFVFLALYFSVVCRFGMNVRGTFWWGFGLLAVTIIAVLGFDLPIPALVPMCAVVIFANWKEFSLQREEVIATTVVSLLVAALLTASGIHTQRTRSLHKAQQHSRPIASPHYSPHGE